MRILFTVTNQLDFDQRMIRICNSLTNAGHLVKLVGVQFDSRTFPQTKDYQQKRLTVFFKKGFGFYFEYNVRLFFFLLFQKTDIFCCIDVDTMLPVYFASVIKRKIRIYDAHEYFSQQKEIITRPKVYKVWHFIERTLIRRFKHGYTVSDGIAVEFNKHYGVCYEVIRNMPLLKPLPTLAQREKIIVYQGSVNEGRGFEYMIPAMHSIDAQLMIYGDGNFLDEAKRLVRKNELEQKVIFKGKYLPKDLDGITKQAYIGINLVEPLGQNQLLSLANKFFDYMHNAVPQVTMNFASYRKINEQFEIAILINQLSVKEIADAINILLNDENLYFRLQHQCIQAREIFNWQNEEKKLIQFYAHFANKP